MVKKGNSINIVKKYKKRGGAYVQYPIKSFEGYMMQELPNDKIPKTLDDKQTKFLEFLIKQKENTPKENTPKEYTQEEKKMLEKELLKYEPIEDEIKSQYIHVDNHIPFTYNGKSFAFSKKTFGRKDDRGNYTYDWNFIEHTIIPSVAQTVVTSFKNNTVNKQDIIEEMKKDWKPKFYVVKYTVDNIFSAMDSYTSELTFLKDILATPSGRAEINNLRINYSPLHNAVLGKHYVPYGKSFPILLSTPGINVNIGDHRYKQTPLHYAAGFDRIKSLPFLLKAPGININAQDIKNETPLHIATVKQYINIVRKLIIAGADVNITNNDGRTALYWASIIGNEEEVHLLLQAGADVNIADKNGDTPLHMAALNGYIGCLRLLLAAPGINVNAKNKWGGIPLHYAVINGYDHCIRILENAPKIHNVTYGGPTIAEEADRRSNDNYIIGRETCVYLLLKDPRTNVNIVDNNGNTPLHLAAKNNHLTSVRLLLTIPNIDVTLKNTKTKTALQMTTNMEIQKLIHDYDISQPKQEIEEILNNFIIEYITLIIEENRPYALWGIFQIANVRALINKKNSKGFTPLHVAIQQGNVKGVEKILDGLEYPEIDIPTQTKITEDAINFTNKQPRSNIWKLKENQEISKRKNEIIKLLKKKQEEIKNINTRLNPTAEASSSRLSYRPETIEAAARAAIERATEALSSRSPSTGGKAKQYVTYVGKKYVVRVGTKGGKYILVGTEKKKVYLRD